MESRWSEDIMGEKKSGEKRYWEKAEIRFPSISSLLPVWYFFW